MSERRTSAAKDILTPDTQRLLETYGVARNHFEHARDPMVSQQHVDLAREQDRDDARAERGSILEKGGDTLPEFQPPDRANDNERTGSKMVQEDRPKNDMRPPEEFAKASDRETFDKKWFEEQLRADQLKEDREPDRKPGPEPER